MRTTKKHTSIFCSMVERLAVAGLSAVLLFTMILCTLVSAAANGIYLTTTSPSYTHPVTGVVEDPGNNQVLGQSMVESAVNSKALIEVDPNGNTFATVRLKLMDNIQNPSFSVQPDANSGFSSVSATVMQEDLNNNTSDFRFAIPSENAIVRATFYVVAMGRNVIFYISFSGLQQGSGDFVTSVTVSSPQTDPGQAQQPEAPASSAASPASSGQSESPQESSLSEETPQTSSTSSAEMKSAQALLEEASGLAVFAVNDTSSTSSAASSEGGSGVVLWVTLGVIAAAVLGAGGYLLYIKKFRKGGNR